MERKELFFSLLNKELSKDGFKFVKSKKIFRKKENGNDFFIEYETWPYFFAIKTHYYIFLKEVEKIKKKAWGEIYQRYYTLGDTKQDIEKTDTEKKVIEVAKKEIKFYHSFLKDYFKKNSNYEHIDKTLNEIPGKNLHLSFNEILTSYLAIIVAKLTNNPKIEELFVFYRNVIISLKNEKLFSKTQEEYIDESIVKYDLLVDYLRKMKK